MPRKTGEYQQTRFDSESVLAFIPYPLPPQEPALIVNDEMLALLHAAEKSLARLETATTMIPSPELFIYAFVRKEAVISSQVEGTQATLVDIFNYEADAWSPQRNLEDVQDVCNYLDALKYAFAQLDSAKGLPVSMRLLNETHKRLLKGTRGEHKQPGQIRTSQNWIGGSRPGNATYVPPPPSALGDALSAMEKYIHGKDSLHLLIRIGLVHVQFESIHPYLDGNGRIGRLLIALLLKYYGLLSQPLLYLSLHFNRNRQAYYDRLMAVRTQGQWEAWTCFFLQGVRDVADESMVTAQKLFQLLNTDRRRLVHSEGTTMASCRLFEYLPTHPIVTQDSVASLLQMSKPTAKQAIDILVRQAILTELTGRRRNRSFGYANYLTILNADDAG
ncbi:MAG: Fic family protein [Myxococcales bacterium]|nr:Fic family protein [Myxococcales bacterium]